MAATVPVAAPAKCRRYSHTQRFSLAFENGYCISSRDSLYSLKPKVV
jgi:hypothetical protein